MISSWWVPVVTACGCNLCVMMLCGSTAHPDEAAAPHPVRVGHVPCPAGDVVLQEDLVLDCAPDGLLLLPRLPYLAGDRLGNTVVDMLLVGDQIAGYRPSCLSDEVCWAPVR